MAAESKSAQLEKCHLVRCWPDEKCLELCSKLTDLPGHSELETHTVTESQGVDGLQKIVDSVAAKSNTDLILLLLIGAHTVATHKQLIALFSQRERELAATFICVLDPDRAGNAAERLALADVGVNMVSGSVGQSVQCARQVLSYLHTRPHPSSLLSCPQCGMRRLREEDLWAHYPLYHVITTNLSGPCPVCKKQQKIIPVHLHDYHGAGGRGEVVTDSRTPSIHFDGFSFSIVRRSDNKFLVVQEFCGQGYWFPSGRVDRHESFQEAAIRETKEEAGVDIELTGILTIEQFPRHSMSRGVPIMEVCVYFVARMTDEGQEVKTWPDYESAGACWVTLEEMCELRLRSESILPLTRQVVSGKPIAPLSLLRTMDLS